jgi:DNA-binding response OmpR family regulator
LEARPTRIWVLEDDPGVQFVYQEILDFRYELLMHSTVQDLHRSLTDDARPTPDLLIADLRLPDQSFLGFLDSENGRSLGSINYMVVSSIDDVDALRHCFNRGALDYLTKPFGKGELIVKLERILEKRVATEIATDIELDPNTQILSSSGGMSVQLTNKEFQLLSLFLGSKTRTLTRSDMLVSIWGLAASNSKALDVHLHNLRKKVAPIGLKIVFNPPNEYSLLSDRMDS